MKTKRLLLYLALGILIAGAFLSVALTETLWGSRQLVNEPLHSAMEAIGALLALLMALLLLQRESGKYSARNFLLAMGFLSMGIIDSFHVFSHQVMDSSCFTAWEIWLVVLGLS